LPSVANVVESADGGGSASSSLLGRWGARGVRGPPAALDEAGDGSTSSASAATRSTPRAGNSIGLSRMADSPQELCSFVLPVKRRRCKFAPRAGSAFCHHHDVTTMACTAPGETAAPRERVPCPLFGFAILGRRSMAAGSLWF
jgi:hypothetical protein